MKSLNHNMLILAREARGLTQAELVNKVPNLSQGNYSRMEKGLLPIPDDTLCNIAKVLNFPTSFFTHEKLPKSLGEYYYRKRATMPRKQQIKLESIFDVLCIWIDELLKDIEIPDLNLPSIEVVPDKLSPKDIARKIRAIMDIPKGPINNLVRLLEKNGVIVYFLKCAPDKFDGTTIITHSGQRIIVINSNMPNDRKRFTICHEFGHQIMHLPFSPIIDVDRNVEEEANIFASEFLMPELDIRRDLIGLKFSHLDVLKRYWKVSKAALIRRAYDLGNISKEKYTYMMIELSRMGERKAEKNDVEIDHPIILRRIVEAYYNELEYPEELLLDTLGISKDDFDHFILGVDNIMARFKIVV